MINSNNDYFTENEKIEIQKLFGLPPERLEKEIFKKTLRELRAKFHPDNFEKFDDDTVRQMATERFQNIETLGSKVENWFNGKVSLAVPPSPNADPLMDKMARFAYREMKIELRTSDKDLKYRLFGTFYRWLMNGDKFKIPNTTAWIIADEEHAGRKIGFVESIRMYLTFGEHDAPEIIVLWLYERIREGADSLLIEGEIIPINYDAILLAVKRRSFLRIG